MVQWGGFPRTFQTPIFGGRWKAFAASALGRVILTFMSRVASGESGFFLERVVYGRAFAGFAGGYSSATALMTSSGLSRGIRMKEMTRL